MLSVVDVRRCDVGRSLETLHAFEAVSLCTALSGCGESPENCLLAQSPGHSPRCRKASLAAKTLRAARGVKRTSSRRASQEVHEVCAVNPARPAGCSGAVQVTAPQEASAKKSKAAPAPRRKAGTTYARSGRSCSKKRLPLNSQHEKCLAVLRLGPWVPPRESSHCPRNILGYHAMRGGSTATPRPKDGNKQCPFSSPH